MRICRTLLSFTLLTNLSLFQFGNSAASVAQEPVNSEAQSQPEDATPPQETENKGQADKPAGDEAEPKSPPQQGDAGDQPTEEPQSSEEKSDERKKEDAEQNADSKEPAKPKQPVKPAEPARLPKLGSSDGPMLPGQPWRVHDVFRPRPRKVAAPANDITTPPPGDAIVLFDGTDLSAWAHHDREDLAVMYEAQWKVEDGYFEVTRGNGDLFTIDNFADVQLHLEWQIPESIRGSSQGRGNSGVKFLGLYEVQILDSFNNLTYADGQAAAIYGQYPPAVNASRKPGEWQTYDIIFEMPRFDGDKLISPGYLTVLHNGVLVHHRRELAGVTGMASPGRYRPHPPAGPIMLQDHGNPIRFRNIWVRRLGNE